MQTVDQAAEALEKEDSRPVRDDKNCKAVRRAALIVSVMLTWLRSARAKARAGDREGQGSGERVHGRREQREPDCTGGVSEPPAADAR